jgi:hypothetical protein
MLPILTFADISGSSWRPYFWIPALKSCPRTSNFAWCRRRPVEDRVKALTILQNYLLSEHPSLRRVEAILVFPKQSWVVISGSYQHIAKLTFQLSRS